MCWIKGVIDEPFYITEVRKDSVRLLVRALLHLRIVNSFPSHVWQCYTHTDTACIHTYLGSIHADDAVAVACAVVKIGDGDSLLAGRHPVLLCGWVNLEDMGPGGVDRLLPEEQRTQQQRDKWEDDSWRQLQSRTMFNLTSHILQQLSKHSSRLLNELFKYFHHIEPAEPWCVSRDVESWEFQHGPASDSITQTPHPHGNPQLLARRLPLSPLRWQ